ncbi:MAG: hypothetical protein KGL34_00645, partial [Gammaproteobacteria bacterium]|nr:hypothetical protein [Gammaproteobacteria bacterium]
MSNTSIRSWNGWIGSGAIKAFALVLPMLWAAPARADLYSASQAYEKKDYVTAFREFKELAEMGQP